MWVDLKSPRTPFKITFPLRNLMKLPSPAAELGFLTVSLEFYASFCIEQLATGWHPGLYPPLSLSSPRVRSEMVTYLSSPSLCLSWTMGLEDAQCAKISLFYLLYQSDFSRGKELIADREMERWRVVMEKNVPQGINQLAQLWKIRCPQSQRWQVGKSKKLLACFRAEDQDNLGNRTLFFCFPLLSISPMGHPYTPEGSQPSLGQC